MTNVYVMKTPFSGNLPTPMTGPELLLIFGSRVVSHKWNHIVCLAPFPQLIFWDSSLSLLLVVVSFHCQVVLQCGYTNLFDNLPMKGFERVTIQLVFKSSLWVPKYRTNQNGATVAGRSPVKGQSGYRWARWLCASWCWIQSDLYLIPGSRIGNCQFSE